MNNKKKILIGSGVLVVIIAIIAAVMVMNGNPKSLKDGEVLAVDKEVVTEGVYNYILADSISYMETLGIDVEAQGLMGPLKQQTYQTLMEMTKVRAICDNYKIKINTSERDDILQENIDSFETPEEYNKFLEHFKMTEEDLVWIIESGMYQDELVKYYKANIKVPDEELEKLYNENPAKYNNILTSQIVIAVNDKVSEAEAEQLAKNIIAKLDAGEDFATLAKQYGTDGTAQDGGKLNVYFTIDDPSLDKDYRAAAFKLENVGDYTKEPVKSQFGYHIIKLDEKNDTFSLVKEKMSATENENKISDTFVADMEDENFKILKDEELIASFQEQKPAEQDKQEEQKPADENKEQTGESK